MPEPERRRTGDNRSASRPRPGQGRDWVLTARGRRAISVSVGLALVGIGVAAVQHRQPSQTATIGIPATAAVNTAESSQQPSTAPSSTTTAKSPTSAMSPSPSSAASRWPGGAGVDAQGYRHSGVAASGTFATASLNLAPTKSTSNLHTFAVRVETSLPLDPNAVARTVAGVLNDPRSWVGTTGSGRASGASFQLVNDSTKAQLTITVAAPQTVDKLCPLDTKSQVSCDDATHVLLNYDRWTYATPFTPDLSTYRAYLVNHEVGHFLGLGHQPCPGPGKPAPVMLQQTKGLQGCTANGWPTVNP